MTPGAGLLGGVRGEVLRDASRERATALDASTFRLTDGREVRVRAIRPGDIDRLQAFIKGLSVDTRYQRFMHGVSELPPALAASLANADGHRHVGLVAMARLHDGAEVQVADARLVTRDDAPVGDFAIVVADAWQNAGLGSHLIREVRRAAIDRALDRIEAEVLGTNGRTIALLRRLGFSVGSHPEDRRLVRAFQDFTQA